MACAPREDSDQPWSLPTHWAHIEDYDQTGRMPRLIWVFAGRKDHFVGLVMRRLIYFRRTFAFKLKCSCWKKKKKGADASIWGRIGTRYLIEIGRCYSVITCSSTTCHPQLFFPQTKISSEICLEVEKVPFLQFNTFLLSRPAFDKNGMPECSVQNCNHCLTEF